MYEPDDRHKQQPSGFIPLANPSFSSPSQHLGDDCEVVPS